MLNIEELKKMNYPDFVGYINQWNVPPGAYSTLSKWKVFGNITDNSNVIELACTSGFSLRELSILSGCSGVGVDLSPSSIESAIVNKNDFAKDNKINFLVGNADSMVFDTKFTHVVIGAALKFFDDPKTTIAKIADNYLLEDGYVLASPFYAKLPVPEVLIDKCKRVFGISITSEPYKEVMDLYKDFEIIYEDRCDLIPESENELAFYCDSIINKSSSELFSDEMARNFAYSRLLEIKRTTNELREYQAYSVLILRYRSKMYGKRYTEIF